MTALPMYGLLLVLFSMVGAGSPAQAQVVDISNPAGGIIIKAGSPGGFAVRAKRETGAAEAEDFSITFENRRTRVIAVPRDGKRVDLEVDLPFGAAFTALTRDGSIRVEGLVFRAEIGTQSGAVELALPWRATRLLMVSEQEPASVVLPPKFRFTRGMEMRKERKVWVLQDRLNEDDLTYGQIAVGAGAIPKLTLTDIPYPEAAPVKMHWLAPPVLDTLLIGPQKATPPPSSGPAAPATPTEEGVLLIRSEVREVSLLVSVTDEKGMPVAGLTAADFEVLENQVPQTVSSLDSQDVPFNLALYLDLSGSAKRNRPALIEALRGFIGLARPQDRVAVYVLVDDQFQVISRLTNDRQELARALPSIPAISGGSPVYDTLLLAYAEEILQRPKERNAIIAITDGLDNQIDGTGTSSRVSFRKLERAAEGMHALIFPILLPPFTLSPSESDTKRARERMESLAAKTGGKLFPAAGPQDMAPIYPQVADTLRSVYSMSYSPKNQDFKGEWRGITVRVKKPGVKARTRSGYFAR
jgi:Ca-activated chloride channel homolog